VDADEAQILAGGVFVERFRLTEFQRDGSTLGGQSHQKNRDPPSAPAGAGPGPGPDQNQSEAQLGPRRDRNGSLESS